MGTVIKVVDTLESEFAKINQISGQDELNFGYGDKFELDRIIVGKTNNRQKMYPLAWYLMPNELEYTETKASGSFTFLIAHNSQPLYLNDQRFKIIYDDTLFPYMESILKMFEKSRYIIPAKEYRITEFPNYSESGKNVQIDCWDALRLIIDLEIYKDNEC